MDSRHKHIIGGIVTGTADKFGELLVALRADFKDKEVVVIGLGYVGLTLGAYLAELGFRVHGVEIRELVLESLNKKKSFFWEPKLDDLLARNIERGTFTFSSLIPESSNTRVFIITVGTPINSEKRAILDSIINVSEQVSQAMKDGDMVILRSTVKLNTTSTVVGPILGKSGKDFDLAFCPERTLEGAALTELGELPQIVGAPTSRSRIRAATFFQQVTPNVVNVSNAETAEMVKLVDNMQRDVSFAVSNEIAHLCNSQPIRASEVISAGKLGYKRTNLFSPGPVGGPCLEKDSYLLAESLESFGGKARVAMAARETNENVIEEAASFISNWINFNIKSFNRKVAVLGMAFKGSPETNDLRGSPSLNLVHNIKSNLPDAEIYCWDPVIHYTELLDLGHKSSPTIGEVVAGACAVILVNNHPTLSNLDLASLFESSQPPMLVYDFWGRNDQNLSLLENKHYHSWGNHHKVEAEESL
jgi:UDP-N-acetyl-D-mannosaminuronic acid dehydrogenase